MSDYMCTCSHIYMCNYVYVFIFQEQTQISSYLFPGVFVNVKYIDIYVYILDTYIYKPGVYVQYMNI